MMQQYLDIKEEHKDEILFFRLGDFYEMFFDDAITASRELELTLTGKQCGLDERAPMCGVPFHAADTYIARLIGKGYKVAICEQVEDPAAAKGIVKREVIQIVTPGTAMNSTILNDKENNYIASVFSGGESIGLSYCDVSTGELCLTSFSGSGARQTLINELVKIGASELILDEGTALVLDAEDLKTVTDSYINVIGDKFYRTDALRDTIKRHFSVSASRGIGVEEGTDSETALGALLLYLYDTQKSDLSHIRTLSVYTVGQHMSLDKATIKNLELTETLFEKKLQGSLLGVLDKTHTAMGSRTMKHWLRQPLNNADMINARLDAVEVLLDDVLTRNNLKENLKRIYDFERLAGRIATGRANGLDLVALANSCRVLPEIRMDLSSLDSALIAELREDIYPLEDICAMIDAGIVDEPPFTIKEGGLIKAGYSEELDNLKSSIADAQHWIASLETTEKERTGIKNLRVGFNKVFGYYIEVTKSNYDLVPDDYIRKQTLVNCERFITPQLKETERLVLNAEAEINKLEYELFCSMRDKLKDYIGEIQSTSRAVAVLDVLAAFAQTAEKNDYVKPLIDDGDVISIEQGRHPVIEQTVRDSVFVSNDTYLDRKKANLLIITGPNMSGKSTYMRQTALIVLMAQAGCFVPAARAHIGLCDRIFTRIGASDNLAQGQSTFFVEMSELAYILNSATSKSLIILDEIGRGTSTYDGLSIAWATAEFVCKRHIRTLFATHYHEMTVLENTLEGIRNLNVDVIEDNGNIVFLHKIVEGSASRSYGIHVAQLAGVPDELLTSARSHLDSLGSDMADNVEVVRENTGETQLTFFETVPDPIKERLKSLDLMNTTPSEALKILEDLKKNL
ncbi:MAG: DNA mismatch repair protein MutS [Clostridia bacterium]|nr:DNA mismatch repair protein MutS [Clostridia bacterium]